MCHQDPSRIRRINRNRRFDGGVREERASETRLLAGHVVTPAIGKWVAGGHLHQWTDVQLIGERARHHQCTRQGGQADEGVSKVVAGSTILHFALPFRWFLKAHQKLFGRPPRLAGVIGVPQSGSAGTKPAPLPNATSNV
jgi:hypothetical protein